MDPDDPSFTCHDFFSDGFSTPPKREISGPTFQKLDVSLLSVFQQTDCMSANVEGCPVFGYVCSNGPDCLLDASRPGKARTLFLKFVSHIVHPHILEKWLAFVPHISKFYDVYMPFRARMACVLRGEA